MNREGRGARAGTKEGERGRVLAARLQREGQPRAEPQRRRLHLDALSRHNHTRNAAGVNVRFLLDIRQTDTFKFFINVEALPSGQGRRFTGRCRQPAPLTGGIKNDGTGGS